MAVSTADSLPANTVHGYVRVLGWLLLAITVLTPLVVVYALIRPNVGQMYFFVIATLIVGFSFGVAWLFGAVHARPRLSFPVVLLGLYVLSVIGSLFMSRAPLFSVRMLLLQVAGIIFLILILLHPVRRVLLGRLTFAFATVALLLALHGIMQYFGYDFLEYSEEISKNRVISTIGHPNFLASVLGPAIFLLLSIVFSRRRRGWGWTVGGGLLAFVMLFCIMLARTRGVWLGLLFGLTAVIVLGTHYGLHHGIGTRLIRGLAAGVVLALAGLGLAIFFFLPALNATINLQERLTSNMEIKSRVFYWSTAVDLVTEARPAPLTPLLGLGYAMYDSYFWDYTLEQQKTEMGPFYWDVLPAIAGVSPGHVHNEYLEVLAEQGLFGFIALMAVLVFFLYFGYLAILREPEPRFAFGGVAVFGAYITILTDAMFAFPWRLPVSLIVFMVVLAWLYEFIYPQRSLQSYSR